MLDKLQSIRFELSGFCNYNHELCPKSRDNTRVSLSTDAIKRVMVDIPGFSGDVGFHNHNEPTIDPRLYSIVSMAKGIWPKCTVSIYTNGEFLDENLIKEGIDAGVDKFNITAYSDSVRGYFKESRHVSVYDVKFDGRLGIYDRAISPNNIPCGAPVCQIVISRYGDVCLCCQDWNNTVTFGNVYSQSIVSCFPEMEKVYNKLMSGDRDMEPCRRCSRTRIKYISE